MRPKFLIVAVGLALPLLFLVRSWKVDEQMYEDDPAPSSPPKDSPPKEIPAENLIYEITDDSVTILGYPYLNQAGKDGGAWAIPAQIKGLPVTRIGPDAFSNGGMGHLTVPNSVVTIERSAFQSMDLSLIHI